MTSRWEGFSLVSAEAMSVGLPIVAFDIPALCEVTDDGRYALLAHDGDVEDFCRQVGKLISSVNYGENTLHSRWNAQGHFLLKLL